MIAWFLMVGAACINYKNFTPQVQTGSVDLSSGFAQNYSTYSIVLAQPINYYVYTLGFQALTHTQTILAGSLRYSVLVGQQTSSATQLVIYAYTQVNCSLITKLAVRWMVVDNDFPYLSIIHLDYTNSSGWHLILGWSLNFNLSLVSQRSSADGLAMGFSGLDLISQPSLKIVIRTKYVYPDNSTITISFGQFIDGVVQVYSINLDTVILYTRQMQNDNPRYGAFDNGLVFLYSNNGSFHSSAVNMSDSVVFVGIFEYRNLQGSKSFLKPLNIDFQISINPLNLSVAMSGSYDISLSYINLQVTVTCFTDQVWNVTTTDCQQCPTGEYADPNKSLCVLCSSQFGFCNICNATFCSSCQQPYYLNSTYACQYNCSSISNCSSCSVVQSSIVCNLCAPGYTLSQSYSCQTVCGDGFVLGTQQCDDSNTQDGDGCSSLCTIQQYYDCIGSPSVCTLQYLSFQTICLVKEEYSNRFTLTLELSPSNLPVYQSVDWLRLLHTQLVATGSRLLTGAQLQQLPQSFDNSKKHISKTCQISSRKQANSINLVQANYELSTNRLRALFQYSTSLQSQKFAIGINFLPENTQFQSISTINVSLPQNSQNNLSLVAFSDASYVLGRVVRYLSMAVAILSLLLFTAGYFAAKLTALECLAVVQVTALLLLTQQNMSPSFAGLKYLGTALGLTTLSQQSHYFEDSTLPINTNSLFVKRDVFESVNIFLAVIFIPLLLAAILKILAIKKYQNNLKVEKGWKNALGTHTFYGIFFIAYAEFAFLALNIRYFRADVSQYLTLIFGLVYTTVMVLYVIMSHRYSQWFGSFKNKFYRFEISQYVYTFEAVQRFLTSFFIVSLGPSLVSILIPILFFILEIIFLAVKKPYIQQGGKSAIVRKLVIVAIFLLFLAANFVSIDSTINAVLPICILLLLLAVLIYGSVVAVKQVITRFKQMPGQRQKQQLQKKHPNLSLSFTQKQQLILNSFKQKMNIKQADYQFAWKPVMHQRIDIDKWRWDHYTELYSLNEINTIKNKLRKNKFRNNEEISEEFSAEKVKDQKLAEKSQIKEDD